MTSHKLNRQPPLRPVTLGFLAVAIVAIAVALALGVRDARAGSVVTNRLPAAKAQIYDRQQQAIGAARAHPQPKLPQAAPLAAVTPAARQAGIVAMRQGPFSPATFRVRNFWQGPVGSEWLLAYAGAEPAPDGSPTRGALRLYTESTDLQLTLLGTFPAPDGTGPLSVVAASGDVLQLRADDGSTLAFSLSTRQYR